MNLIKKFASMLASKMLQLKDVCKEKPGKRGDSLSKNGKTLQMTFSLLFG